MKIFICLLIASTAMAQNIWQLWYQENANISFNTFNQLEVRSIVIEPKGELVGNILYFQGLGDSVMNHGPLFKALTEEGHRVIAFDYFGQGGNDEQNGSQGSMNNTTIARINKIGEKLYWNVVCPDKAQECLQDSGNKMNIIGWSTGGLAAYWRTIQKDLQESVNKVVLLAPGVEPRLFVGEGFFNLPINEITLRTLTHAQFVTDEDPHLDPIRPRTPMYVPFFAADLIGTARIGLFDQSPAENIKAIVFIGLDDLYIYPKDTEKFFDKFDNFTVYAYENAHHEIDNEVESIASDVRCKILNFLNEF